MRRRGGRRDASALVSLALGLGACGGAEAGGPPANSLPDTDVTSAAAGPARSGGRLVVGLSAETNSFSPVAGQWVGQGYQVGRTIFDPLAAHDDQGVLRPHLAEHIEPADDFRSWTITVRPGIRFHDDTPLDA